MTAADFFADVQYPPNVERVLNYEADVVVYKDMTHLIDMRMDRDSYISMIVECVDVSKISTSEPFEKQINHYSYYNMSLFYITNVVLYDVAKMREFYVGDVYRELFLLGFEFLNPTTDIPFFYRQS